MNIKVNVLNYTGNAHAPLRHPAGTSEDNSRFGTLGSLDTFYDCPPVIKHVLCDSAGHSSVFLIPDDRCVDAVFGNTNIRLMFSPTKRHAKTVSRCGAAPLCLLLAALPRRCACTAHPCRTALFEAQPAQCVSLRKEAPRCRYNKAGVSFMSQMMRPAQFMTVQVDEAAVQHAQHKLQQLEGQMQQLDQQLGQVRTKIPVFLGCFRTVYSTICLEVQMQQLDQQPGQVRTTLPLALTVSLANETRSQGAQAAA